MRCSIYVNKEYIYYHAFCHVFNRIYKSINYEYDDKSYGFDM